MDIAVIGGGHGCYAAAAHLSENGHQIRFWRRDENEFAPVLSSGEVKLTDRDGTRDIQIALPTTDLCAAVSGAALVVIPLPCTSHVDLAAQLAPLWEDGQVVFLPPGTFGCYIFAQAAHAAGNLAKVAFAETGTLPYLARKQAADHIRVSVYATRLPTGVMPASQSETALGTIAEAYPAIEPLNDALDGALMNAGPIIHPPLIMMNAGALEHFDTWDIHNEGTQDSIRRVTNTLDAERIRLREVLGYGSPHFPLSDHYNDFGDEWMYGKFAHSPLTDSGDWREHIDLHKHRYMREDTELGLAFMVTIAQWAGIELPVARGILSIASEIVGNDFLQSERSWPSLGLNGLDAVGLKQLLQEGPRA